MIMRLNRKYQKTKCRKLHSKKKAYKMKIYLKCRKYENTMNKM